MNTKIENVIGADELADMKTRIARIEANEAYEDVLLATLKFYESIAKKYKQGATVAQISDRYGMTEEQVIEAIKAVEEL